MTDPGTGRDTGADFGRDVGADFARDAGADFGRDAGASAGWRTGPEAGSLGGGSLAGGKTVSQPWEPMVAAPDEPVKERKPAERHSHRAGRHGRPSRRPWDRLGKDKDGES
jgi:hypothetical protein